MKIPRHNEPGYLDFYLKLSARIEAFLGKEFKVCGFDPDFSVTRYPPPNDLGISRTYNFNVPMDIALKLPEPRCWNCDVNLTFGAQ